MLRVGGASQYEGSERVGGRRTVYRGCAVGWMKRVSKVRWVEVRLRGVLTG